jgi:ATP-binding cassette subfamily F protein uup
MTFKDKHALETLPARMEKLQKDIDTHQATLTDQNLFISNPVQFDATANAMQVAETALAAAEEQWLELEMKREEMKSG